jgi:hypothetical protein
VRFPKSDTSIVRTDVPVKLDDKLSLVRFLVLPPVLLPLLFPPERLLPTDDPLPRLRLSPPELDLPLPTEEPVELEPLLRPTEELLPVLVPLEPRDRIPVLVPLVLVNPELPERYMSLPVRDL